MHSNPWSKSPYAINRIALRAFTGLVTAALAFFSATASATVIYDNYRGQSRVPADSPAPHYLNAADSPQVQLQNLIDLAAGGTGNIASSGSAANIDWSNASAQLCNDADLDSAACQQWLQGRVAYALVKFPAAGRYTFSAAHDDEVKVEFSTNFSASDAANYRNFDYNVPVGELSAWTANENTYENIPGNFVVAQAGACYAMRVHWNNQGGISHLRMRWTPPDGAPAIIPAANLRDPSHEASYGDCASSDTDLAISKMGPETFRANTAFNYRIVLWNVGPNAVSNAIFADTLPSSLTVNSFNCTAYDSNGNAMSASSSDLSVTYNGNAYAVRMGGMLNVNGSTPPSGNGARLECVVLVTPNESVVGITNTATITLSDLDTTNNTSSWTSVRTDTVSVTKSAPATATVGRSFQYQLNVTNNSGGTRNGIVVLDRLPSTVTATQATVSEGTVNCTNLNSAGAQLSCQLNTGAPDFLTGTSRVITLTVTASEPGTVNNHAATAPSGSGNPATNPGSLCNTANTSCAHAQTTLVIPPQLTLVKQVMGGTATADDFTLQASGRVSISGVSGSATVTNAEVPSGDYALSEQSAVSGYASSAWRCSIDGGAAVEGNSIRLANGDKAQCTITNSATLLKVTKQIDGPLFNADTTFDFDVVCANPDATYRGRIVVAANSASGQTTLNIPAGSTNCAIAEDLASRPAAPAYHTWSAPRYVQPTAEALQAGDMVQGTITNPLTRNRVTVTITKNVTGAPAQGAPGNYGYSLVCDTGTYAGAVALSGTATTGSAMASVPEGASCSALSETSKAAAPEGYTWGPETVEPPAGAIEANAQGTITNPLQAPTLTVVKTVEKPDAAQGDTLTYTIKASNSGPVKSTANTTIADTLPPELTLVSTTAGTGWICDGSISCVKAAGIAAGTEDETVVTVVTTKNGISNIVNTATVVRGDPLCEASPAASRCRSSVTVTDNSQPALAVEKAADRTSATRGGSIAYTLRIRNDGPVPSEANTTVIDHVPEGLTVSGMASGGGWTCTPDTGAGPLDIRCVKAAGIAAGVANELIATIATTKTGTLDVTNTANVAGGDAACEASLAPARCASSVTVSHEAPPSPIPVPAGSRTMLLLLGLLLMACATWQSRSGNQASSASTSSACWWTSRKE